MLLTSSQAEADNADLFNNPTVSLHQWSSEHPIMRLQCFLFAAVLLPAARAQFPFAAFQGFSNFLQPFISAVQDIGRPTFVDDGTEAPVATGNDPLFPDDCGRDPDKGTGKLCFPDGLLCQDRK